MSVRYPSYLFYRQYRSGYLLSVSTACPEQAMQKNSTDKKTARVRTPGR